MIMISVALISVIIYLACDVFNVRSRAATFISLLPSVVFCVIQYEQLCSQEITIVLFTYFLIISGILLSKLQVSKSFGFSIVILPWTIILFGAPQTLVDIVVFVVGVLFVLLFVGSDKVLNLKAILDEESNNLVSIIVLGITTCITLVIVNGDVSLNLKDSENPLRTVLQNLLIIFAIHLVGGFGSFIKNEKIINILNRNSTQVFNYIKLTVIPYFVFTNIKQAVNSDGNFNNTSFLVVLMVFLLICYLKAFAEKKFEISSYSLAVHNMVSICFTYLLGAFVDPVNVFVALMFNFLMFEVIKNKYLARFYRLRKFLSFLFVGIPLSPLFLYKLYYYDEIIGTMDISIVLAFTFFTFFPFFLFSFFYRPGMSNVEV